MANHQLPTLTSTYTNFVTEMSARFNDLAVGVDPAVVTATNVPIHTIRWNSANNTWQKRTATDWVDLSTNYAINISGNSATATALANSRTINGVGFNGTSNININLNNALTFNNSGTGAVSGTSFNGTGATTISHNTIGAPSVTGAGASGTWNISISGNVAWTSVTGRPTNVSSFTNDSGYINTNGRAYPRRSDGANIDFYWSGQGGQPTWLWGGNDGVNMFVYNPSNFSVNYANSAGSVPASGISSGIIAPARLGTGTANNTTYLRGDNVWATPFSPSTGFGEIGSYVLAVRIVANNLDIGSTESGSNLRHSWTNSGQATSFATSLNQSSWILGGTALLGTWRKMDNKQYHTFNDGEGNTVYTWPVNLWVRIS